MCLSQQSVREDLHTCVSVDPPRSSRTRDLQIRRAPGKEEAPSRRLMADDQCITTCRSLWKVPVGMA